MKKGFTLIELLIVVAIIAILAAIAVPNFLEAQVRAKVSRVKNDQRSLATGIETYYVDNNTYPVWGHPSNTAAWSAMGQHNYNSALAESQGADPNTVGRLKMIHTFAAKGSTFGGAIMTTPIAYITSYFTDPFMDFKQGTFGYYSDTNGWIMFSPGPDTDESATTDLAFSNAVETIYSSSLSQPHIFLIAGFNQGTGGGAYTYDPTNGTVSQGDVWRVKQ